MTAKHDCSGKIWGAYRDVSGRVYKGDKEAAKYARIARNARLGALVTEETAAQCQSGRG